MPDTDIIPGLCGKPGDPVALPAREPFTPYGMGQWLDTAAGKAAIAAHNGDRYAAQKALEDQAHADEAWRREQGQRVYERDPNRYQGGAVEAQTRVGSAPPGGPQLTGTSAEIEAMGRRVDPLGGAFRVIAPEVPSNTVRVGVAMDKHGNVIDNPELTRPPWQRG